MPTILTHDDASISVEEKNGKRMISVEPKGGLFVPTKRWETSYPVDLIEQILRVKGPDYLCDEITRDESPLYVEHDFRWDILSYVPQEDFAGRRVLDFGSGSGASSMVLARMFPDTKIVGVELVPDFVELALRRAKFHGVEDRVSFHLSPDPKCLPEGIGAFDCILLSAVHEHLLPAERRAVLPLLWSHLKPGGVLFLDQTPYRWFPVEMHTTGLPLINFLPDGLALFCARHFSRRIRRDESWPELLRKGIRGGTVREIMSILNAQGRRAELLEPSRLGVRDRIGLWYQLSSSVRKPLLKKWMMWSFRAIRVLTGITAVPMLSLAVKKWE